MPIRYEVREYGRVCMLAGWITVASLWNENIREVIVPIMGPKIEHVHLRFTRYRPDERFEFNYRVLLADPVQLYQLRNSKNFEANVGCPGHGHIAEDCVECTETYGWKKPTKEVSTDMDPLRQAVEKLRKAVNDKGPEPAWHDKIHERSRAEWPKLWEAVDAVLKLTLLLIFISVCGVDAIERSQPFYYDEFIWNVRQHQEILDREWERLDDMTAFRVKLGVGMSIGLGDQSKYSSAATFKASVERGYIGIEGGGSLNHVYLPQIRAYYDPVKGSVPLPFPEIGERYSTYFLGPYVKYSIGSASAKPFFKVSPCMLALQGTDKEFLALGVYYGVGLSGTNERGSYVELELGQRHAFVTRGDEFQFVELVLNLGRKF